MPKGYWIARVDVTNDDGYKPYVAANAGHLQEIRRTLRDPRRQVRNGGGQSRARAVVVIEFPDYAGGARLLPLAGISGGDKHRTPAPACRHRSCIEGYDGPQP